MKYYILLGFLSVAVAYPYPGLVHDEHALIGESEHHHHVEHEHAKSHQSIKFEHFHPVPVYVKKEHQHLLEHPLESGKHENELKQIHPETQHNHGHGLVLEDHRFNTEHLTHGLEHGGFEGGFQHGGYDLGGFEGPKAYGGGEYELHQPALEAEEGHYQFQAEHEGYNHDSY